MKYIIHYDLNGDEGRTYALAATNKADYIIKALNTLGKDVEIISASLTSNKGYKKGDVEAMYQKIKSIFFGDKNEYKKICRKRAERLYSEKDKFHEYIELYRNICKN